MINSLQGKNGFGLCLIKGPKPHSATDLTPEVITSAGTAQQLLDKLGISPQALLGYLSHQNLYNSYQRQNPLNEALHLLASGDLLAYKLPLPPKAPPAKAVEYLPVTAADRPVPLAPESSGKQEQAKKSPSTLEGRKGVPPKSLDDAEARLGSMEQVIADNGYKPKYTDNELLQQAQSGSVADERYHVRFMEAGHQWDRADGVKGADNLTGKLGREFTGETGAGPRYWSTTFDQIEDADSDPKLICEKLGIDYDPDKKYAMAIIDTEKAKPLTGCECVSATFDNIGQFANRELPAEFPKEFTDQVMNADYQVAYKEQYEFARKQEFLDSDWSTDTKLFSKYLDTTNLNANEKKSLIKRMDMQKQIGNNQHYLGNGVTEDKIASSSNKFGAVETHNFERTPTNLQSLKNKGAIKIVYL
ncbi:MAG: hypothetical protein K0Q78_2056 [Cellvibrio sp.]|nr:hypothetical protein [Cellvibrio sp.]